MRQLEFQCQEQHCCISLFLFRGSRYSALRAAMQGMQILQVAQNESLPEN